MLTKEKIDVADLKIGMYVCELDRPWLGSPFLFQGFPIRTADEIKALQDYCKFVFIDLELSSEHIVEERAVANKAEHQFETKKLNIRFKQAEPDLEVKTKLDVELKKAVELYHRTHAYIKSIWNDARMGIAIDIEEAREMAGEMVESIIKNENAMVWLAQLRQRDEYTTQHSLNVSVFSILFGRYLGLRKSQLKLLGFGALFHDIGKMRVPLEVLNKTEKLTADEMALLKEHPEHGRAILGGDEKVPSEVIDIAFTHHERFDGSGYPRGLSGEKIGRFVYIVSIVDVYDAVTSDRAYHMGISPHEALNLMYGSAPTSFPAELVEEFIRCLGIYPVGSLVELDTGEVGVVMTVNRKRKLRPILTLVLNRDKQPYPQYKMLNLDIDTGEGKPQQGIKKILKSNAYGVDTQKVISECTRDITAGAW